MNVVILTEGGKDKGFGHVARCSSIYQAFRQFNIPTKFIVNGDDSIKAILPDMDFSIFNWLEDLSIIDSADIVVIDSYLADIGIYQEIANKVSLIVSIDDNNRLEYPSGIVVNGTLDTSNLNYPNNENIRYCVGKEYIPLRENFWNISKIKINDNIENIIITMGGSDLRDLTPKLLSLLNTNLPNVNKKVVVTDSFTNINEINNLKNETVEIFHSPDSNKILNIIGNCDLAISASGQTLYELACCGIPTIAIGIIDNQKNNIINWQNEGFIEYAGCWNNKKLFDNILDKIDFLSDKNIRYDKRLKGIQTIDGKGSLRIVKSILNEYYESNAIFRKIKKEDCLKIYEIANDDEVRKNSFNSDKIKLEDHQIWFNMILNNDLVEFFVLTIGDDIIGQLRFDTDEEYPVVSISLNKKYRGLGLSKFLLKKGLESIEGKVIAYVKKDNIASISLFKSVGFKIKEHIIINDIDSIKFIKE